MASYFSANQYENAFRSQKLQNWTIPKQFKERPTVGEGHTKFIASDRGHLLPGVKRGSHITTFVGTWDLPRKVAPTHINPTARSLDGQERLRRWVNNPGYTTRKPQKECLEDGPKLPENLDTVTSPPAAQETPEALPQIEAPPASPRPATRPKSPSPTHEGELQTHRSAELCSEVNEVKGNTSPQP